MELATQLLAAFWIGIIVYIAAEEQNEDWAQMVYVVTFIAFPVFLLGILIDFIIKLFT